MHHMTLKMAIKANVETYVNDGEDAVRVNLETKSDFTPEEIEEIIAELKKGGAPGTGNNSQPGKQDEESEEDEIKRLREENKQMKRLIDTQTKAATKGELKRNRNPIAPGQKEYDLYKVVVDPGSLNKKPETFTDADFVKIGMPKKTCIRLEPYRANRINSQSHNSGERLYEYKK